MKIALFAPVLAFGLIGLSSTASAQSAIDPQEAHASTTKIHEVTYRCSAGSGDCNLRVRYGFNRQNLPTYAQSTVYGKSRFMPINLYRSDNTGTYFGEEDNWTLGAGAMDLRNYNKVDIMIQSPDNDITHKSCRATKVRRIKG